MRDMLRPLAIPVLRVEGWHSHQGYRASQDFAVSSHLVDDSQAMYRYLVYTVGLRMSIGTNAVYEARYVL